MMMMMNMKRVKKDDRSVSLLHPPHPHPALPSPVQDEEKTVRQRRKLASDSNASEVSDC